MAESNTAAISLPWCSAVPLAIVCWPSPLVVVAVVPPQDAFVARSSVLSIADAIPVPHAHLKAPVDAEAVDAEQRHGVELKKPRSSRRLRYILSRHRRKAQYGSLQDAGDQTSPPVMPESLRSFFGELDGVPCERIFLVRRIQGLGLESAQVIRAHFSAYGDVEEVLVAHSPVLSKCKTYIRRLRPSNLAIVIMATAAMVKRVFIEGSRRVVNGIPVRVEPFERRCDRRRVEGKAESEFDVEACDVKSCGEASCDAGSTLDGGTSTSGDAFSKVNDEDVCLSDGFEYWATDDGEDW